MQGRGGGKDFTRTALHCTALVVRIVIQQEFPGKPLEVGGSLRLRWLWLGARRGPDLGDKVHSSASWESRTAARQQSPRSHYCHFLQTRVAPRMSEFTLSTLSLLCNDRYILSTLITFV